MILFDSSYDSVKNEVLFVKIGARILGLWLDMSFGIKWPKCLVSRPQTPRSKFFFKDFIILLDLYYDSGENEILFVKIGARFPDLWLDTSFRPKFP